VDSHEPGSFTTGGAVLGPNGVMYVTSNNKESSAVFWDRPIHPGRLTAINFTDGKVIWKQSLEQIAMNGAAVGHVGPGGTGPLTVVIGIGANPPPPMLTETLFANTKHNSVIAVDAETGKRRWSFELNPWKGAAAGDSLLHMCLPDNFSNAAIGGDGTVYIGNQDGRVYAIQDKNGDGIIDRRLGSNEVSEYNAHAASQGSPAIAPGMLVVAPCNGMHVFNAASSL